MLNGLREVPWENLTHAYGSAADVPGQLEALLGDDPDLHRRVIWTLYGNIYHQGTRYEASAYAVPFLMKIASRSQTPASTRAQLVGLLTDLALGYPEAYIPPGFDPRRRSEPCPVHLRRSAPARLWIRTGKT